MASISHDGERPDVARRLGSVLAVLVLFMLLLFAASSASAQEPGYRGVDVFDAACAACHIKGEGGAQRIGDTAAWAKPIAKGLAGLTQSVARGTRGMPPHGGNFTLSQRELQRAIVYLVNESGGDWVEPADPKKPAAARSAAQVVQDHCALCHATGFDNAPITGDRAAWLPRTALGIDPLVRTAARGHGGMPPRAGKASLTDAELRSAIIYMASGASKRAKEPKKAKSR
jgi:cytochrome c5